MAESRINLEMKLYIGRKLRFFHTQRTDAPRQGGLRPNIAIKVRIYQKVKKFEIHYGNVTDGQTDRQTPQYVERQKLLLSTACTSYSTGDESDWLCVMLYQ